MKPFTVHKGVAAPLLRINVDTDAIIPSREMKTVSKKGLSGGMFAGWRYTEPGGRTPNPDFVLNQSDYADTSILLSGANFGCGSSREHAVWALSEYGIRAIVAPSFGSIFQNNCIRNGVLPVVLPDDVVKAVAAQVEVNPQDRTIEINLQSRTLIAPDGTGHAFNIDDAPRNMLLEGLDPIGLTLKLQDRIDAHIEKDQRARAWAYL